MHEEEDNKRCLENCDRQCHENVPSAECGCRDISRHPGQNDQREEYGEVYPLRYDVVFSMSSHVLQPFTWEPLIGRSDTTTGRGRSRQYRRSANKARTTRQVYAIPACTCPFWPARSE